MFDIVDVLDVSKTTIWWSAKDKSGQRGWAPSNYFVAIEHTSIPRRPPRPDPPSTDLGSGYSILPVMEIRYYRERSLSPPPPLNSQQSQLDCDTHLRRLAARLVPFPS